MMKIFFSYQCKPNLCPLVNVTIYVNFPCPVIINLRITKADLQIKSYLLASISKFLIRRVTPMHLALSTVFFLHG